MYCVFIHSASTDTECYYSNIGSETLKICRQRSSIPCLYILQKKHMDTVFHFLCVENKTMLLTQRVRALDRELVALVHAYVSQGYTHVIASQMR